MMKLLPTHLTIEEESIPFSKPGRDEIHTFTQEKAKLRIGQKNIRRSEMDSRVEIRHRIGAAAGDEADRLCGCSKRSIICKESLLPLRIGMSAVRFTEDDGDLSIG
jgi:hypothetical protein